MTGTIGGAELCTASARLTLRPLTAADAGMLRAITDDPAITAAISFLPDPFTLADAEALIAQNDTGRDCFLGLWRSADRRLIGVAGAHLDAGGAVEIGYWIAPDCWGQGYACEAAGALVERLEAAFVQPRIFAECRPDNRTSWRVLEKLGFEPTGAAGARPGRVVLAYRG
jgi:RimJ/RimL family protein N-acetyltransferase